MISFKVKLIAYPNKESKASSKKIATLISIPTPENHFNIKTITNTTQFTTWKRRLMQLNNPKNKKNIVFIYPP